MTQVLDRYRAALATHRDAWLADVPALFEDLRARHCEYGGRVIVQALRPKFLSRADVARFDYTAGHLMALFRRLVPRVLEETSLQHYLGLREEEMELLRLPSRCPDPCPFVRLDSFETPVGPRFVELNGECPAGPGFTDASAAGFRGHPGLSAFLDEVGAEFLDNKAGVLHGLWMAWTASGGCGTPQVLITDYLEVPTAPEFTMIAEYLTAHGMPTMVEDPRNLTFQNGALIAKGKKIDLVYRRVLTNEYLERRQEVKALEQAVGSGAVVMVNPFQSKAIHKKAAFGLLSGDEIGQEWMSPAERAVVQATIPWTRKVREGHTKKGEERIDLLPWMVENKDRLVLKPNDDYGGKGITIGWEVSTSEFEAAVQRAVASDYVVQERIQTIEEPFPLIAKDLQEQPMIVDLDPYVYFGKVHGVLARLAAGALCNVTSGGGQVPVAYVDLA